MTEDVFAYGTLTVPAVLRAVVGRELEGVEAVLEGWASYRVRGRAYPAAIEQAGARTAGRLYRGVDAAALERLDRYEGSSYERRRLEVHVPGEGRRPALAWVYPERRRVALSDEPWDRARFEALDLAAYLRRER